MVTGWLQRLFYLYLVNSTGEATYYPTSSVSQYQLHVQPGSRVGAEGGDYIAFWYDSQDSQHPLLAVVETYGYSITATGKYMLAVPVLEIIVYN